MCCETTLFITNTAKVTRINYINEFLGWFDLSLKDMATCDVVDQDGQKCQHSNVDHEPYYNLPDEEQEALDKAAETTYEITKEFEPEILEN